MRRTGITRQTAGIGNGVAALVERLQALYVDELRQSLVPPVGSMANRRQTEALIRRARTIGPAAYTEPDATTWIWSDLHLATSTRAASSEDRSERRPPSTRR